MASPGTNPACHQYRRFNQHKNLRCAATIFADARPAGSKILPHESGTRNNLYRPYGSVPCPVSNSYALMSTFGARSRKTISRSPASREEIRKTSCLNLNLLRQARVHRRDCFASAETAGEIGLLRISRVFAAACLLIAPKRSNLHVREWKPAAGRHHGAGNSRARHERQAPSNSSFHR